MWPYTADFITGDIRAISVQNGKITVPEIVTAPEQIEAAFIRLAPNVISAGTFSASLLVQAPTSEMLTIYLTDCTGRVLQTQKRETLAGRNQIELPTAGLTSGVYFVFCRSDNTAFHRSLTLVVH